MIIRSIALIILLIIFQFLFLQCVWVWHDARKSYVVSPEVKQRMSKHMNLQSKKDVIVYQIRGKYYFVREGEEVRL